MLIRSQLVVTVAFGLLTACGPSEDEVLAALDEANYCLSANECERIEPQCPFGCNIYVNTAEADQIRELLAGFDGECTYKCDSPTDAACVEGSCESSAD
jgi:hypothetical protein